MSEPSDAELAASLLEAIAFERKEVTSPAHHLCDVAEKAAQRLEARGEITEGMVNIAVKSHCSGYWGDIGDDCEFPNCKCVSKERRAMRAALEAALSGKEDG